MKIHLVSDLHEDVWRDYAGTSAIDAIPANLGDVLVVAGDVLEAERFSSDEFVRAFERLRGKAEEVIYVPGNHEFYRLPFDLTRETLKLVCLMFGIHFLDCESVEIGGHRFLGTTLWYNPLSPEVKKIGRNWSDYCIRGLEVFVPGEHRMGVEHVKSCRKGDVVVTHMLPSYASVAPKHAGDSTNVFFVAAQLDNVIKLNQPALWIHGHTHTACDYRLNHTRIVCSPLGTPREASQLDDEVIKARLSCVVEI